MAVRNCPFYGCSLAFIGLPFALIAADGNRCALVTTSHAPCKLEIEGRPVEWSTCERLTEITLSVGGRR